jgi:hypothetical protein
MIAHTSLGIGSQSTLLMLSFTAFQDHLMRLVGSLQSYKMIT